MKNLKFVGQCIAFAFIGMTVYNAVSGYNIKNNGNLNNAVLAFDPSSSGSGSTGGGIDQPIWKMVEVKDPNKPSEYYEYKNHLGQKCDSSIYYFRKVCDGSGTEFCSPTTGSSTSVNCVKKL
jgi:hypothetical protein